MRSPSPPLPAAHFTCCPRRTGPVRIIKDHKTTISRLPQFVLEIRHEMLDGSRVDIRAVKLCVYGFQVKWATFEVPNKGCGGRM